MKSITARQNAASRPRVIIALIMRSQILRAHRLLAATNKMMNRLKLHYG